MLVDSERVYEIDAVGDQVVYHHVDIASLNNQHLNQDASVFTSAGNDILSNNEPVRGFHLHNIEPSFFERANRTLTNMTKRGLPAYIEKLEIPPSELTSPKHRILDIGSGAQQELSRDAQAAGFGARIISIDPGLALDEGKDLSRLNLGIDISSMKSKISEESMMTKLD